MPKDIPIIFYIFKENKRYYIDIYLSVSWRETLPPVHSDQGVLLDRNVKLEEVRFLHGQPRAPEYPRRNALSHPPAHFHLPAVNRVVLLMDQTILSWRGNI